ncbi:FecR family protein [Dyadobacter pollutisoli]|uniref:FecR domain-containing protein n=1 Tax=Dyadobacter pollutisoli TaxID=2910158 RepID=A0A9E8NAN6_9BACT|nr:FecR domain-containing protein [Dyadobacter pollutisoli]WAC13120.1 FecR domain-containing protein [Dyadobacter pollutisoli]
MNEQEVIASLVKRYVSNLAGRKELEVFFYMLGEGKLDEELERYMDREMVRCLKDQKPGAAQVVERNGFRVWKMAASVIVVLGAGLLAYLYYNQNRLDTGEVQYTYIHTRGMEVKKIKLADGSEIWLNEVSSLKYPKQFEKSKRELFLLDGEAYFKVKRDENRPFVVHAGGTVTKVLGTEFNVRSYRYLPAVRVTVTKGKVRVAKDGKETSGAVLLLPNQRASFDRGDGLIVEHQVNTGNAVAWKQGRLVFDNEMLQDVAAALSFRYGVQIEIEGNDTKSVRLSAEFESTDSLIDVMEAISLANNLEYTSQHTRIHLKPKK